MQNVRKLMSAALITSVCALSSAAHAAEPLYIVNNTDKPITTFIHGAKGPECSTKILKNNGVSWPKQTHMITAVQLKIACRKVETNCYADVFLTDNCGADGSQPKGFARISVNEGIKEAKMFDNSGYDISFIPNTYRIEISPKN